MTIRGRPPFSISAAASSHDLDVVLEGVEARLAGLGVVADRDDQYVLGLDAVDAEPTDLGVREQRKRVEVVERLAFGLLRSAVVDGEPTDEPLLDQRARGRDPDAARAQDPDPQPRHSASLLRACLRSDVGGAAAFAQSLIPRAPG